MNNYWSGATKIRVPWLIQRCKADEFKPTMKTGDYLNLDYMGSAEFEFGSIPQFQRDVNSRLKNLVEFSHEHNGMTLYFLAEKGQEVEYEKILNQLIDGSIRLKERSGIKEKETMWVGPKNKQKPIYDDPKAPYRFDVWFDLYNAIIFSRSPEILKNLRLTIPNSVKYMDAQKEKK